MMYQNMTSKDKFLVNSGFSLDRCLYYTCLRQMFVLHVFKTDVCITHVQDRCLYYTCSKQIAIDIKGLNNMSGRDTSRYLLYSGFTSDRFTEYVQAFCSCLIFYKWTSFKF